MVGTRVTVIPSSVTSVLLPLTSPIVKSSSVHLAVEFFKLEPIAAANLALVTVCSSPLYASSANWISVLADAVLTTSLISI